MATINLSSGGEMEAYLSQLSAKVEGNQHVSVGFLADKTYPAGAKQPGLHVAQVAFWNEFGTVRAPPRPFFRAAIKQNSPDWTGQMGIMLKRSNYDMGATFGGMGEIIKDEIVQSINTWTSPQNAPSTIRKKGFDAPLRDTDVMLRSVNYEVKVRG